MSYSQNQEDLFVLNYFGDYKGSLLSIGENDGITLSNSKLAIEHGWNATLLEPGSTFNHMKQVHLLNDKVQCLNVGIGQKDEAILFYESGNHVPNGNDRGLVSCVDYLDTERWRKSGVQFEETQVNLVTFKKFMNMLSTHRMFDFISIDAESFDWKILQQIDLDEVGCKCLCIEHNGDPFLIESYILYCGKFGMKEALRNNENQIFVR